MKNTITRLVNRLCNYRKKEAHRGLSLLTSCVKNTIPRLVNRLCNNREKEAHRGLSLLASMSLDTP